MQQGSKSSWTQIVNMIKETSCFVSNNSDEEQEGGKEVRLPDNQIVKVKAPRYQASEAIFDPGVVKQGDRTPGVHELVFNSIQECDIDIRKEMY